MFKKLKRRLAAYRKIALEIKLQEERQAQYEALVGESCSYPIIKDLINSAAAGVIIKLVFKDGTTMSIVKDESIKETEYSNNLF